MKHAVPLLVLAGVLAFAGQASAQIVNGNGPNGSPSAPIGTKAGGPMLPSKRRARPMPPLAPGKTIETIKRCRIPPAPRRPQRREGFRFHPRAGRSV